MEINQNNCVQRELHEECGVFGVYNLDHTEEVASSVYYGLFALQHRGQESCGIAVSDTEGPKAVVNSWKGMGLVNEVFNEEKLENLVGNIAIGHVRYPSESARGVENTLPLVILKVLEIDYTLAVNTSI